MDVLLTQRHIDTLTPSKPSFEALHKTSCVF